jgi:hypothetical protein
MGVLSVVFMTHIYFSHVFLLILFGACTTSVIIYHLQLILLICSVIGWMGAKKNDKASIRIGVSVLCWSIWTVETILFLILIFSHFVFTFYFAPHREICEFREIKWPNVVFEVSQFTKINMVKHNTFSALWWHAWQAWQVQSCWFILKMGSRKTTPMISGAYVYSARWRSARTVLWFSMMCVDERSCHTTLIKATPPSSL